MEHHIIYSKDEKVPKKIYENLFNQDSKSHLEDEMSFFFWSWNNVLEAEEYNEFLKVFLNLHSSNENCQILAKTRADNYVFNTISSLEDPKHLETAFSLILSALENYHYSVILKKSFINIFDHLYNWNKIVVSNSLQVWLYIMQKDSKVIDYFDEFVLHILYTVYKLYQSIEVIEMLIILLKSQYSEFYIDLINSNCFIELFFNCLSVIQYDNQIVLLLIECIKLLDGLSIRDLVFLYSDHLNVIKSSTDANVVDSFKSVFSMYM